jgi:thiol-disulfide isomerase/thioredoxin
MQARLVTWSLGLVLASSTIVLAAEPVSERPADIEDSIRRLHDAARACGADAGCQASVDAQWQELFAKEPDVWEAAFRTTPASEHDAIRARVKAELARVRALDLETSLEWWRVLEQGYRLTGDHAAQHEMQAGIATRFPCEADGLGFAVSAWEDANRPRTGEDAARARQLLEARFQFTGGLVERCPDSVRAWRRHFSAAVSRPDLAQKDLDAVVDRFIDLYGRQGEGSRTFPSAYETVAQLYVDRGFHLDRVKDLLEKDRMQLAYFPGLDAPVLRAAEWRRQRLTVRVAHQLGRTKDRDAGLVTLEAMLEAETDPKAQSRMTGEYAALRAEVAASQQQWADAFGLYQEAAAASPDDNRLRVRRDDAWKQLGGSPAVLQMLVGDARRMAIADSSDWKSVERPLPIAHLERLIGGEWTTAALKGKRTLVDFWAMSCGPCLKELPFIQRLHDRIKDRPDIAVVTLNVDDNVGLIAPFVAENKYTFPVILAAAFFDKLGIQNMPTNWIVDDRGIVTLEATGFDASRGDTWIDAVIAQLEAKPELSMAAAP